LVYSFKGEWLILLIELVRKIRDNKKTVAISVALYIGLMIWAKVQASLSSVSQPVIKVLKYPFFLWDRIAPLRTETYTPNPFLEWIYILGTFIIVCFFIYSVIKFLFGKPISTSILCEKEVSKLIKKIESHPLSVIDDDVMNLLKEFEKGYANLFGLKEKECLCVWVHPVALEAGKDYTNEWVAFCTDSTNPQKYIEIIQTGVLKRDKHVHYLTDLKSYETDALEFAFIKNIGEFKFGLAILFMKKGKVTEVSKQQFQTSSSLIHYMSQVDKITMAVV
jgi:hypothetical protein